MVLAFESHFHQTTRAQKGTTMAGNNCSPPEYEHHSSKYPPNFTSFQINSPYHARIPMVSFTPSLSCNNSSTSDDADESHMSIVEERKHRRTISNRESARRSRMRKQRQLDELCMQVLQLRDENHGLMNELNRFTESHEQVVLENDKLKKDTMELRKLLSEAQLASTYTALGDLGFFRDLDDGGGDDHESLPASCITAHLRAQYSHKSTVGSTTNDSSNLLH